MIVKGLLYTYRAGSYQLTNCGRLAVPLIGKTGPALYFSPIHPQLLLQ
jgi:hypothetical protein